MSGLVRFMVLWVFGLVCVGFECGFECYLDCFLSVFCIGFVLVFCSVLSVF